MEQKAILKKVGSSHQISQLDVISKSQLLDYLLKKAKDVRLVMPRIQASRRLSRRVWAYNSASLRSLTSSILPMFLNWLRPVQDSGEKSSSSCWQSGKMMNRTSTTT